MRPISCEILDRILGIHGRVGAVTLVGTVETVRFSGQTFIFLGVFLGIVVKATKRILRVFSAGLSLGAGAWAVVWALGAGALAGWSALGSASE